MAFWEGSALDAIQHEINCHNGRPGPLWYFHYSGLYPCTISPDLLLFRELHSQIVAPTHNTVLRHWLSFKVITLWALWLRFQYCFNAIFHMKEWRKLSSALVFYHLCPDLCLCMCEILNKIQVSSDVHSPGWKETARTSDVIRSISGRKITLLETQWAYSSREVVHSHEFVL